MKFLGSRKHTRFLIRGKLYNREAAITRLLELWEKPTEKDFDQYLDSHRFGFHSYNNQHDMAASELEKQLYPDEYISNYNAFCSDQLNQMRKIITKDLSLMPLGRTLDLEYVKVTKIYYVCD